MIPQCFLLPINLGIDPGSLTYLIVQKEIGIQGNHISIHVWLIPIV